MSDVFQEQIEYYEARAPEYDDWFYRRGRYDWGIEKNLDWANEADAIRRHFHEFRGFDESLELASGTGLWTTEILKTSEHVTCLDASAKMIEINRQRNECEKLDIRQVDLFAWRANQQFDLVFTSFWLSHVPVDLLEPFLKQVTASLKSDGLFYFIDSRLARASRAKDHEAPEVDTGISNRKLDDGREYQIVKIFHDPEKLAAQMLNAGLKADIQITENYFLYGTATRC